MIGQDLARKKILITGATSGIGEGLANILSNLGCELYITGRDEGKLAALKDRLENVTCIKADFCKTGDIENLANSIDELDGIVNSAGIVRPFPIKFINQKQINKLFDINYTGPVNLVSLLFKQKKINKGASLVFMSSISSKFPHKGGALYSGSKAAINSYSKTIALEYADKKIRSNVILAAMVKTPLFDEAERAVSKELMDKHGEQYPLGFGEVEDISNACVFLLSNASKWITGTELVMDGGLTAGQ
jgi:NAD(P)-dependent dehydrogenase (short-subunit alcohol dehydrogenase family)